MKKPMATGALKASVKGAKLTPGGGIKYEMDITNVIERIGKPGPDEFLLVRVSEDVAKDALDSLRFVLREIGIEKRCIIIVGGSVKMKKVEREELAKDILKGRWG